MTKTTAQMLAEMLTENTGTHFLDSGGAYGRHWQRNQGKTLEDWENQPSSWLDRYGFYTRSVFHYLLERVAYEEKLDKIFQRFADQPEFEATGWLGISEAFIEALKPKPNGLYGEGDYIVHYTYNNENNLTQDVQFCLFTCSDETSIRIKGRTYYLPGAETYVLLQIHGGADARGGLTRPRLFSCDGEDMFSEGSGYIQCVPPAEQIVEGQVPAFNIPREDLSHQFMTDDTYRWYCDGMYIPTAPKAEDFEWDEEREVFLCTICKNPMEAI